jgi:ATP-dependent 26S proteasome regulatory subunit
MSKLPIAAKVVLSLDFSIDVPSKDGFIMLKRLLCNMVVRTGCLIETLLGTVSIKLIIPENNQKSQDCIITMATQVDRIEENVESISVKKSSSSRSELHDLLESLICYPKSIKKLGIDLPKGILLYGPPGVGKTSAVMELCKVWDCHLVKIVD